MKGSSLIWRFLSNAENRERLAWLSGGITAVLGGMWTAFLYFSEQKNTLHLSDVKDYFGYISLAIGFSAFLIFTVGKIITELRSNERRLSLKENAHELVDVNVDVESGDPKLLRKLQELERKNRELVKEISELNRRINDDQG